MDGLDLTGIIMGWFAIKLISQMVLEELSALANYIFLMHNSKMGKYMDTWDILLCLVFIVKKNGKMAKELITGDEWYFSNK